MKLVKIQFYDVALEVDGEALVRFILLLQGEEFSKGAWYNTGR